MGRNAVGGTRGGAVPRRKRSSPGVRLGRYGGPRNPDGTWVAGVERGPYKPVPFPVGTKVGELTVIGWAQRFKPDDRSRGWHPVVRCSCGREGPVDRGNFKRGASTRCDVCAKKAAARKRYWKYEAAMADAAHRERLLNRLSAAINRCHSPGNRVYKHYGGRGIHVCSEWREDKAAFLRYVQTLPGWDIPALDMDRADNDRGYEPGNIRFATKAQSAANKRRVEDLEQRIRDLEKENASLRHSQRRA